MANEDAITQDIDAKVRAVCPIDGVGFGDLNNKATWRIDYGAGATTAQRNAAQNVINSYNVATSTAAAVADLEFATIPPRLRKWILDVDNRVRVLEGQPVRTAAQLKTYITAL